ncbi:hypothetical protein ScalyP_jg5374 [Parmales sp. scaly parma]|nr:hypothetical protein ScalyP_jg5374 [Parmales sp. scaly parma]
MNSKQPPTKPTKSSSKKTVTVPKKPDFQKRYEIQQAAAAASSTDMYGISRRIHQKTKYVKRTQGGGSQVRTKLHFLDALHAENYALAAEICGDLLEEDGEDEMLLQYSRALEGIVKEAEEEGTEEEEDGDSEAGTEEESSEESSENEEENNSDDSDSAAEKKDDNPQENSSSVNVPLPSMLEEMFHEAKMPQGEREKLQELRAQFSSLKASVGDKNEANERNWSSGAAARRKAEEK